MSIRFLAVLAVVLASAALAPAAPSSTIHSFQTPSGNIACIAYLDDDDGETWSLRCDISQRDWDGGDAGPECEEDDGDSLGLGASGRPYWVCHGDTVLGPFSPVVSYGSTWSVGPFRCALERSGVTCRNRSDRGFMLSRASYRLF